MPASLLELKKRIASVKQTSKITEAMHMVSAAKLNQTEKRDKGYQEYNQLLHQTVSRLMSASVIDYLNKDNYRLTQDNIDYDDVFGVGIISDMIKPREEVHSVGYLVVTGDRGLVGSYNSSVIKQMMSLVADDKLQGRESKILSVGSVGSQFFKKNNLDVVYEKGGVSDVPTFKETLPIVSTAIKMYLNGVYDELYVCYTHHVNSLSSAFRVEKMLPIVDLDIGTMEAKESKKIEFEVAPDIDSVLATLLPQFARAEIYGAILDAKTAEHASSMTAMKNATDNAKDLVSSLSLQMNRARQAQITTELTEIVSGANALE